jgi:hypothetical protein
MAYVVARPKGRFEIRESLHTATGPRARSLAGFAVLTDEVLAKAARRAQRPFDVETVVVSGRRAGAPVVALERPGGGAPVAALEGAGRMARDSPRRFVEASWRMARAFQQPPTLRPADPGAALIDLLGFADAVTRSQPRRRLEPLKFPVLLGLVAARRGAAHPV